MENKKSVVGVYRVLYLFKVKDEVEARVAFVCSAPSEVENALKGLVDNPDVVRVSREVILYFDCDDIGKVEWLKNDFVEKKEDK